MENKKKSKPTRRLRLMLLLLLGSCHNSEDHFSINSVNSQRPCVSILSLTTFLGTPSKSKSKRFTLRAARISMVSPSWPSLYVLIVSSENEDLLSNDVELVKSSCDSMKKPLNYDLRHMDPPHETRITQDLYTTFD